MSKKIKWKKLGDSSRPTLAHPLSLLQKFGPTHQYGHGYSRQRALQLYFPRQSLVRFHHSISNSFLQHTTFCQCSTKTDRQHGLLSISLCSPFPLVFELCSSDQQFLSFALQLRFILQPNKLNRNHIFLQSIFFFFWETLPSILKLPYSHVWIIVFHKIFCPPQRNRFMCSGLWSLTGLVVCSYLRSIS